MNDENIFQTYMNMVKSMNEERQEGTPLIVHHYTDSQGQHHGSLDQEKIKKMSNGRTLKQTHISDYHGHLMSKDYN